MDARLTGVMIVGIFAALIAFLGRYEVVGVTPGGEGVHGIAYRLDRWTGEVIWMSAGVGGKVESTK